MQNQTGPEGCLQGLVREPPPQVCSRGLEGQPDLPLAVPAIELLGCPVLAAKAKGKCQTG